MASLEESEFYCYCGMTMLGWELQDHFAGCETRSSTSDLSNLMARYKKHIQDQHSLFVIEQELKYELLQLQNFRKQKWPEDGKAKEPPVLKPVVNYPSPVTQPQEQISHSLPDPQGSRAEEDVPKPEATPTNSENKKKFFIVKHDRCAFCGSVCSKSTLKLECGHTLCTSHIVEEFRRTFVKNGDLKCMAKTGCPKSLTHPEMKKALGDKEFDDVLDKMAVPNGDLVVQCVCGYSTALEPGPADYKMKDLKGKTYSREAAEQYSKFRFKCPRCNQTKCASCQSVPYHDGMTCDEIQQYKTAKKCRYCDEPASPGLDHCQEAECMQRFEASCKSIIPLCGHRCFGVDGEDACPRCLEDACSVGQMSGTELCAICYTEKLMNSPVVMLACGHLLHFSCLKSALDRKWPGPRITFSFAKCPLCKEWATAATNTSLLTQMEVIQRLYFDVRDRGFERLRLEPEENKRINDPSDANYYLQPEKYIMDRFCFYECYRCKALYYGGKKECADNEDPAHHKPEEMLCVLCSTTGSRNCKKHGVDFIEFKCRFCCNVAVYFCWGTTHFCKSCHDRHNGGDSLTEKKKYQLPQCPGIEACPLRIRHPANGEEYVLGCSLCRKEKV